VTPFQQQESGVYSREAEHLTVGVEFNKTGWMNKNYRIFTWNSLWLILSSVPVCMAGLARAANYSCGSGSMTILGQGIREIEIV
jgi:hypothetical protein